MSPRYSRLSVRESLVALGSRDRSEHPLEKIIATYYPREEIVMTSHPVAEIIAAAGCAIL
jgi:hypothetical protein